MRGMIGAIFCALLAANAGASAAEQNEAGLRAADNAQLPRRPHPRRRRPRLNDASEVCRELARRRDVVTARKRSPCGGIAALATIVSKEPSTMSFWSKTSAWCPGMRSCSLPPIASLANDAMTVAKASAVDSRMFGCGMTGVGGSWPGMRMRCRRRRPEPTPEPGGSPSRYPFPARQEG